jgi:hypothetical protein
MTFDTQRPIGVSDALEVLRPGSKWYCHQNEVEGLVWVSKDIERPSDDEILDKIQELKAQYEATEYQRQRAPEYPDIKDQLDAIWKGGDAYEEMLARVMEVKTKYPKPE